MMPPPPGAATVQGPCMSVTQQFYLEHYERYYRRGIEAHRKGELDRARHDLLKAAEMLYKLAAASTGQLRDVRKQKAGRVLEMAQRIKPGEKGKGRAQPAAAHETTDGEGGSPRGDEWIIADPPEVSMDDIAGLVDVKATIRRRVIYPFQHPEVTARFRKQAGGGVLLYGPPGTGKTMIARAVANEVDATFFSVRCSDIMSKWVGEAEKNLRRLFDAAAEHARAVVFLDETEAIVARRGSDSTVMNRVIPEFLALVDGMAGRHPALLLLGATNRPWDIDEAALRPGRFGELIYVPLPDAEARRAILAAALRDIPLSPELDVDGLAERTAGLSGADLVGLCERAKDLPYEREITMQSPQCIEPPDIDAVLATVRPSVSAAMLARYEKFQNTCRTSA